MIKIEGKRKDMESVIEREKKTEEIECDRDRERSRKRKEKDCYTESERGVRE